LNLIEILPEYVIYGFYAVVAFVAGMILLSIWKNISPAAPGIPLGYYEVIGRYAGGSLMKRIQGTLVDSTYFFLNPELESKFKKYILKHIREVSKKKPNPKGASGLLPLEKQLMKFPLERAVRIIVTRDRLWKKHILVQWGYVDKPLIDYAMHEDKGKFTFSTGLITRGVITGTIHTLPEPWIIPKIGKCTVHLFLPDARREQFTAPPSWLAKIALYAPSIVELNELLESKDETIADLRRLLADVSRQNASATTGRDALLKVISIFSTERRSPEVEEALGEALGEERYGITDILMISGPAGLGAYLANYYGYEWFYGLLAGLAAGYFLYRYFKRRKRL